MLTRVSAALGAAAGVRADWDGVGLKMIGCVRPFFSGRRYGILIRRLRQLVRGLSYQSEFWLAHVVNVDSVDLRLAGCCGLTCVGV